MPPLCITKGSAHPILLAGYLFQSVQFKNFSCEEVGLKEPRQDGYKTPTYR
jgi:hypothetical protein